ncbi:nucleotide-binding universal stress UspA family protein [Nocardioides sp. BE266]|uniref:universal stress protein n=1 Tax=Nocardioides sp. BE266 TaxID=2817725 RepID=UPI0028659C2E|nr:universal stress protein [Nocardioides sp. BE266]MDR7255266.1 nucleotide-binding universal stress UspA family protein [Nocardioides sp. BE266]
MIEHSDSAAAPPVVVAVGPDETKAAVRYGAEQALRAGCPLHLVHAVPVVPQGPETVLITAEGVEKFGRESLALAAEQAEDVVHGLVPVVEVLRRGAPVPVLVRAAKEARMVVLEHRHLSRLARLVNRTIAGGVAAHTRVPVVAVPTGWRPSGADPVVVVGVDVPERSGAVLAAASAEARIRGASLRVVHAWSLPDPYDGLRISPEEAQRWTDRSHAEICAALDALGDVEVAIEADVRVRRGGAVEALVEAATDADLLVIGRHDPLLPVGSHIGPVARAVLREATCPVLLAAPEVRR